MRVRDRGKGGELEEKWNGAMEEKEYFIHGRFA